MFGAYGLLNEGDPSVDPQTIVVEREDLLTFLQYRSRAFDEARFGALLDAMPAKEVRRLADEYVREEALYREAKALQLDENDYVSRRRLIQQLEFLTQGFVSAQMPLTEGDIIAYYEARKDDYYEMPRITFTHVFMNGESHQGETEALARTTLLALNQNSIPFEHAMSHGDRFLYHVNYVAKEPDLIASYFGEEMCDRLFALEPSHKLWQGPFRSPYGMHLVMVTERREGYVPDLGEVRERVAQDALRAREQEALEASLQMIVATYDVQLADDLDRQIAVEAPSGATSKPASDRANPEIPPPDMSASEPAQSEMSPSQTTPSEMIHVIVGEGGS